MEKAQDWGLAPLREWRLGRDEEAARWDNAPYLEADRLWSREVNVRAFGEGAWRTKRDI